MHITVSLAGLRRPWQFASVWTPHWTDWPQAVRSPPRPCLSRPDVHGGRLRESNASRDCEPLHFPLSGLPLNQYAGSMPLI
ncbi:MAG: hypothetical protein ACJA00_001671 [Myxococcota bacterium]|jgi:hypothetical protein